MDRRRRKASPAPTRFSELKLQLKDFSYLNETKILEAVISPRPLIVWNGGRRLLGKVLCGTLMRRLQLFSSFAVGGHAQQGHAVIAADGGFFRHHAVSADPPRDCMRCGNRGKHMETPEADGQRSL